MWCYCSIEPYITVVVTLSHIIFCPLENIYLTYICNKYDFNVFIYYTAYSSFTM
jgi:hypothetical protein